MNVSRLKNWKYEGVRKLNDDQDDMYHCFYCRDHYIFVSEIEYLKDIAFILKKRFNKGYVAYPVTQSQSKILYENLKKFFPELEL